MIVLSEYPFHNLIHQLQPHTTLFIRTLGIQMSHLFQSASCIWQRTCPTVCVCDVCGMCDVCVCVCLCVRVCGVWWYGVVGGGEGEENSQATDEEEQPFTQKLSDSPSNSTSQNAQKQGEMLLPILSPIPFQMDGGWVMVWMFDRPSLNLLGEFFYYFLVRSF